MTRREDLWEIVHAALDQRRDPLADPGVQRLVAEDPGLLDELARFEGTLALVRASRRARTRRRWLVVAGAATLVACVAVAALWATRHRPAVRPLAVEVQPAPYGAVLACRVTLEHADERGTEILRAEDGLRTRTFVARDGTRIESAVCTALARDLETRP